MAYQKGCRTAWSRLYLQYTVGRPTQRGFLKPISTLERDERSNPPPNPPPLTPSPRMMARTFRRQPSPRHLALQRLRSLATSEPPRCIFATATLRPNDHPTDGEQWGGDEVTAVLRDLRERSGGASPDLVFVIANHMMGEGVLEKCVANIRDGLLDADDFPNTMEALGEAREVEAREVGGRGGVIIGASTTGGVINEFANGGEHMEPEPLMVVMAGSLPKGSLLLPFSVSGATRSDDRRGGRTGGHVDGVSRTRGA